MRQVDWDLLQMSGTKIQDEAENVEIGMVGFAVAPTYGHTQCQWTSSSTFALVNL
jgi:hypothetical protein